MRAAQIGIVSVVVGTGLLGGIAFTTQGTAQRGSAGPACGASSKSQVRTTLYFGLQRPKGSVSELEWQMFLRDEVTLRFPDGLTVWEAEGQWKTSDGAIGHERSKVLLLVHADTLDAHAAVQGPDVDYCPAHARQQLLPLGGAT